MWFQWMVSPLNKKVMMMEKTVMETTSWITFSWTNEKGPPVICEPIRLAGIMKQYSIKAIPQLNRMIRYRGQSVEIFISWSFKLPYHANVINTFEIIRSRMVNQIFIFSNVKNRCKGKKYMIQISFEIIKKQINLKENCLGEFFSKLKFLISITFLLFLFGIIASGKDRIPNGWKVVNE